MAGKFNYVQIFFTFFIPDATTPEPLSSYSIFNKYNEQTDSDYESASYEEYDSEEYDSDYEYSDEETQSENLIRGENEEIDMIGSIFDISAPLPVKLQRTTTEPPVTTVRFTRPTITTTTPRPTTPILRLRQTEATTTPSPPSFAPRPVAQNRPLTKSEKLNRIKNRLRQLNSNGRWHKRQQRKKKLGHRVNLQADVNPFTSTAALVKKSSQQIINTETTSQVVKKRRRKGQRRKKKFGAKIE